MRVKAKLKVFFLSQISYMHIINTSPQLPNPDKNLGNNITTSSTTDMNNILIS
jgi:hypothetical protein